MAIPARPVNRGRKPDITQQLAHFGRAAWRRKRILLLVAPLVAVAAAGIMLRKGFLRPPLEARVMFGVESPAQLGASELFAEIGDYRVELIRSRNFLAGVVRALSLQLVTPDYGRSELFDTVRVSDVVAAGRYVFDVAEGHTREGKPIAYRIRFTNAERGYKNRLVAQGDLVGDAVRLPGIYLVPSPRFRRNPHDFSFQIQAEEQAITRLVDHMSVEPPSRRAPDYFTVSLQGNDYPLVAQTLNILADGFVEQNTQLRKRRSSQRLVALEKQLASAREQFEESEAALRRFLSAHPSASLQEHVARTVTTIAGLQADSRQTEQDLIEAKRLRARLQDAQQSGDAHAIREVLVFLESRDDAGAAALRDELTALLQTQSRYKLDYMPNHPLIRQNATEIHEVGQQALQTLNSFIARLRRQVAGNSREVNELSENLHALPQRSLQHAELQRRHEINSEIYTSLQTTYNQARVADAVSASDIFVIDYAVAPTAPPYLLRVTRVSGFAFFASLFFSVGLVLVLDYIDRTASTEFEVSRMTDLGVLESIPTIHPHGRSRRVRREANESAD